MQSLISFPSKVVVPKAEIAQLVVFKDAPVYIWYEWTGTGTQFTGARRVYLADAVARWSHERNVDRRGHASRAAMISVEVYVALQDNAESWKLKGLQTANETLDNLATLFAMQHNLSFEIERRLHGLPNF